ncbi:MAG TPA: LytTR family DNA-binding domain-containing protein [Telluria sp.]|nr:LytTR family DNA-binding domain-containing protein [Telluria sp.]
MRVLIVDDEHLARALVREYLAAHPGVEIVGECANGFEAVKAITELSPDLVFLDIQMPKLDGFEVAELAGGKTRYLFVTAFDQFALRAFEVHAVDYLLKPFSRERFDQALAHARAVAGAAPAVGPLLADASQRQLPLERVLIRDGAKVHVVPASSIDYIEAQDDYVELHAGGKTYLKHQALSELETQLDPNVFVRIHRSWLVNLASVRRIEQASKDSHCAVLDGDVRLPISRSGYQKIRDLVR